MVSFDFTAQPVSSVHFGEISYQFDRLPDGVPGLISGWRALMRASDEDLTTALTLMPGMMGQPPRAVLRICYADPGPAAAAAALGPFRRLAPVVSDEVRVMPYAGVLADAVMPPGTRMEVRNAFVRALDDETVTAIGELHRAGAAVELRSLGGAVARVPADGTAFAHRDAEVLVVAGTMTPPGAPCDAAGRALAGWPAVADRGSGAYTGFLGTATVADIAAAYPPATYERLSAVKRGYDPGNVFRRNLNIRPAHF